MGLGLKRKNKFSKLQNVIRGLRTNFETEFSLHLILGFSIICIGLGIFFEISWFEWAILSLLIGVMFSVELINSSIEAIVDLISPEFHPLAKASKDTASAAEGVFSFLSVIISGAIFLPEIMNYMML